MNSLEKVIKPNFNEVKELVKSLSPAEKLKLNDIIWKDNIEIPIEHQELVRDRKEKAVINPDRLIDWNSAVQILNQND